MKLTRVHIIKAETCGNLLDDLDVILRAAPDSSERFDPLCLVGPNGTGKSQFLQVIAEAFQVIFHACTREQERQPGNEGLEFEIEYTICPTLEHEPVLVRVSRRREGRRRPKPKVERRNGEKWVECALTDLGTRALLPTRVIGYTSGDNETLSLPFLVSRSGYAEEVASRARSKSAAERARPSPDTRLMFIDYQTHLEVLVANLICGPSDAGEELLKIAKLSKIHSFRCIVQLAKGPLAKLPPFFDEGQKQRGVQLTEGLKRTIEHLQNCSTCYEYDKKTRTYTFDFLVNDQTRAAFGLFWDSPLDLYSAIHKLSMLNDLAIPKRSRERLQHDINTRRFASRLPEPQDEDRVFRFQLVQFEPVKRADGDPDVDYVSLSDGEHQFAQILGIMSMVSDANVLFLLDEPESHFNPQWRVKFMSRLMDLPTARGKRSEADCAPAQQDCLMTTHAPFVPSDMSREKVLIFKRDEAKVDQGAGVKVERPRIETYGTAFDKILQACFEVRPPISDRSRAEIAKLKTVDNPEELREGIARLGDSVDKIFLMDRYRQLVERQGK